MADYNSSKSMSVVIVLSLMMSLCLFPAPATGISCNDAVNDLMPCLPFLIGVGPITVPCCDGVGSVSKAAATDATERKSVCQCLKQAAIVYQINITYAQQIPHLCHVNVPVPINPNVDCNSIPLD